MRILLGSAYFESHRGGIEIVAGRLAREFRRAGHSVAWMAADATSPPAAGEVCDEAVPLRAFNGSERWLGIPLPLPGLSALQTIRREVARADVVNLHDALYPANVAAFLFARLIGKPVVLTQHIAAVPYRHPLPRAVMRAMNRLVTRPMLGRADQAVFIGNATAQAFADVRFRRPPRIIFNGVDTGLFRPAADAAEKAAARSQLGLSADRPVALFVGRFVEKKGLDVLRRAAALGTEIDWVLAGWGKLDPAQWCLPNVFVRSGLDQASLAPLYRASDVFVLPSTGEGFPLVLQEALSCGLPSVCGAETAQADTRLAGLVRPVAVNAADPAATAAAVLAAVRQSIAQDTADESRRRSELIRAWYSWPHAAEQYEDIFRRAAQEQAKPISASPSHSRPATGTQP
jgi:glycosyltransferase involved in cell wall biosynthesis